MRILAGGSPLWKFLFFFIIIPIAVSAIVFVNAKSFGTPDVLSIGIAVLVFFVVYALMSKVVMMV
jgi:hypothetical protein